MKVGIRKILAAAREMDWEQVLQNGGPPCFYYDPAERRFCGRAARWQGHGDRDFHEFFPLDELLEAVYGKND